MENHHGQSSICHRLDLYIVKAMAALTKAQGGLDTRHIQSIYQHQERWSKTLNRLRRGEVNDPYWTPCDYSSSYGTDSCE
jgi:hypothetical protein